MSLLRSMPMMLHDSLGRSRRLIIMYRRKKQIREESGRAAWGHFNVLHVATALRADVYPIGDDALAEWGMARRQAVTVADDTIWIAPIEYVILKKLTYYHDGGSERHLRDIAAMIRLSGNIIDDAALRSWVARLELEREWAVARQYVD